MAESEGFEPSRRLSRLHDFQSLTALFFLIFPCIIMYRRVRNIRLCCHFYYIILSVWYNLVMEGLLSQLLSLYTEQSQPRPAYFAIRRMAFIMFRKRSATILIRNRLVKYALADTVLQSAFSNNINFCVEKLLLTTRPSRIDCAQAPFRPESQYHRQHRPDSGLTGTKTRTP